MKIFLTLLLFNIPQLVFACTCLEAFNSSEKFERDYIDSDVVALVKVSSSEWSNEEMGSYVEAQTLKIWRGEEFTGIFFNPSDDCAPNLKVGKKYYLFAKFYPRKNIYIPGACSYTVEKSIFNSKSRYVKRKLQ